MPIEWLLSACLALLLDQVSKETVLRRLPGSPMCATRRRPRIRVVISPGTGLGLFRDRRALTVLWPVVVLCLGGSVAIIPALQTTAAQIALGAAVGGASSNLIDLRWRAGVIDFIDLRIWPVFNLADCAIAFGAGFAIWSVLRAHA